MQVVDLFKVKSKEIRALHLTWIAFFLTFFVWFNMAPLATTMLKQLDWLNKEDIKLFAICNVALTIPARIFVGMALDRYGPRRVYSILMIVMGVPALTFAFGDTVMQLLVSRLVLSSVGAGFVVGIHMTALWFKPRDIGFAEGFYAGWGNFGSAGAAMVLPYIALTMFGGDNGWRYALAASAIVMMVFGVIYWFAITDGPEGTALRKPRKVAAMEVSSWLDMFKLIACTIPMFGILSILVWRIEKLGYLDATGAWIAHAAVWTLVVYKVYQVLRVNIPILKAGVPEDDRYNFDQVAALNTTYFANFGAELAVVSMLPAFFQETWDLSATTAGIIASSFAFVNLFARPLGGFLSDRMANRKKVMLIYMFGIAAGFAAMGLMNGAWPVWIATAVTVACSMFVQGAEGATFAIVPMIKRRLTGQVSGMAGAYGNVGAVAYLTLLSFVDSNNFFFVIAAGAAGSFLFCLLFLKEPQSAFADDYHVSSVDRQIHAEQHGPAAVVPQVGISAQ